MKPLITKTLLIAGLALVSVPTSLFAQKEKEKDKSDKDKSFQQIIITRTGNTDEKTVVEIKGDKVLVNGKDVKDNNDVKVHVNTVKTPRVYTYNGNGNRAFSYNFDNDGMSLFSENSNRA